jgi:hypothetical protein
MDFLDHRGGGVVFCQVFFLSPLQCTVTHYRNCKRLSEFDEIEISMQSCRVTLNSKEENSYDFCLDFWISFKNYLVERGGGGESNNAVLSRLATVPFSCLSVVRET